MAHEILHQQICEMNAKIDAQVALDKAKAELEAEVFTVPKLTAQIGYAIGICSLGKFLVAATEDGSIQGLHLGDTEDELMEVLRDQFRNFTRVNAKIDLSSLTLYLDNPLKHSQMLPHFKIGNYDSVGTTFQRKVLRALREIPAGKVLSYSELALKVGSPAAVQTVAWTCSSNNIAVLIPCHRVIKKFGALGGYRWGIERKKLLLKKEGYDG